MEFSRAAERLHDGRRDVAARTRRRAAPARRRGGKLAAANTMFGSRRGDRAAPTAPWRRSRHRRGSALGARHQHRHTAAADHLSGTAQNHTVQRRHRHAQHPGPRSCRCTSTARARSKSYPRTPSRCSAAPRAAVSPPNFRNSCSTLPSRGLCSSCSRGGSPPSRSPSAWRRSSASRSSSATRSAVRAARRHVGFCTTGVLLQLESGDSLGGVTRCWTGCTSGRPSSISRSPPSARCTRRRRARRRGRAHVGHRRVWAHGLVLRPSACASAKSAAGPPFRWSKGISTTSTPPPRAGGDEKRAAEAAAVEAAALHAWWPLPLRSRKQICQGARAGRRRARSGRRRRRGRRRARRRLVLEHHAAGGAGDGAVLVFLPGVAEISALVARLQTHTSLLPLPLHSGLQTADQRQCFQRAPARRTKVVVATDIAEASVTIPDVTLVVDGGLHRTVVSDERTGVASLVTARVSRAAAQQRAGRAGCARGRRSTFFVARSSRRGSSPDRRGAPRATRRDRPPRPRARRR